jgi:hypothetical protein
MTDTRERFLREIAAQVPADRIAEVHLFRPLRRGMTETGVAVIAAERADAAPTSAPRADAAAPAASEPVASDAFVSEPSADDPGPYASAEGDVDVDMHLPGDAEAAPVADQQPADTRPERHTVFTARYRLTIKGAERGKWEFDVVADADAPLGAVDTVVRGVQRRAGDDEEPERLTADGVRAALDGQSWRATA